MPITPATRNAAHIPMAEARGFTRRFDKCGPARGHYMLIIPAGRIRRIIKCLCGSSELEGVESVYHDR